MFVIIFVIVTVGKKQEDLLACLFESASNSKSTQTLILTCDPLTQKISKQ